MSTIIFVLAFITFLSTLVGGAVAVRYRKVLQYFFAFASGSLIAVAFFDILPESIGIAQSLSIPIRDIFTALVASFVFYSLLERYFLTHHIDKDEKGDHPHVFGPIGAGGLVIHSFLDGIAIGAAYLVNPAVGAIVALAVIFHDFTDGINTVTLMLRSKQNVTRAKVFLAADALAPVLGVATTLFVSIGENYLAFILAIFAGEFLYIGASHMLPETYKHPFKKMMVLMVVGVTLIYVLTLFV